MKTKTKMGFGGNNNSARRPRVTVVEKASGKLPGFSAQEKDTYAKLVEHDRIHTTGCAPHYKTLIQQAITQYQSNLRAASLATNRLKKKQLTARAKNTFESSRQVAAKFALDCVQGNVTVPSTVRVGARPARKIPLISRAIAVEAGTVAPTDFDLPVPPTEAEFQPSTETVPSVEDLPIMPEEVVIEEESFFQENKRLVLIGGAVAAGLVALLILRR